MSAKIRWTTAACGALLLALHAGSGLHAQVSTSGARSACVGIKGSPHALTVAVGKAVLVDCVQPIKRVAVGLGDVAEATAVSATEIMVDGKAAGETSLILWNIHGGRQFFDVTVRPSMSAREEALLTVRRELRSQLPGQPMQVNVENNSVFLSGTVKDLTSSQRAVAIASIAGKVVNLLNVNVPDADQQILLKVRFASVDRNKARQLGINVFSTGLGNTIGAVTTGQYSSPAVVASPNGGATASLSSELNLYSFFPGLNLGATIQALETEGVVQVLAEPNVMATNGKQASFLAGGEYPYPVVQGTSAGGAGAVTIMFKEYGVRLNFIPTITPRGTIRLQVAPEVSALDFSNAVQVSGFDVPAITTRKVQTEVELKDGQSFAIGGLLDNRETETFQKIPFLGSIPILGKFFQSMSQNRTNTELIVIVTPELVAPIPAGAPLPQLKYPSQFMAPNSKIPMHTPDAKTAANTPAPPPATIPVEKLMDSMKPEKPLVIDSTKSVFGAGSNVSGGSGASSQ